MSPLLIILGLAAVGGGAYLYEESKKEDKKKPQPGPPTLPPAITPPVVTPGAVVVNVPKSGPTSGDLPIPVGPSGLPSIPSQVPASAPAAPKVVTDILGAAVAAAQANALAHMTQPQPADQPPLPAVSPVFNTIPPGKQARVTTSDPGQAGNLRVRSAASTTAPVVPGGEPSIGGGIPKGEIVTLTGPAKDGFVPLTWKGITGWGWAGYVTPI